MVWMTAHARQLDAAVSDALKTAWRTANPTHLRERLLNLAKTELMDNITETLPEASQSAPDRVNALIVANALGAMRWQGQGDVGAQTIVDLCLMNEALRYYVQQPCNLHLAIMAVTHNGPSPQAQRDALMLLLGPTSPLKLKPDALTDSRFTLERIIELAPQLGLDINGGRTLESKRATLCSVIYGNQDMGLHTATGAMPRPQERERAVAAWLGHDPDIDWIWSEGTASSAETTSKPALDWAGHSPTFVRHAIEAALKQSNGSPFPALWINHQTAGSQPLMYYALAHGMQDLIEQLHNAGADPDWNHDNSLLARRAFTPVHLHGRLANWIQPAVSKQYIEQHVTEGCCDSTLIAKHVARNWPEKWNERDLISDRGMAIAFDDPALRGPLKPQEALTPERPATIAYLMKHGLVHVCANASAVIIRATPRLIQAFEDAPSQAQSAVERPRH